MATNQKPLKLVVEKNSPYRLIIPEIVEKKIRYYIGMFPHTEWSGYLFYDYTGSFDDPADPIVFTARDFYLLDVGTGGSTTFKDCPEVLTYAINHNLLDCQEALIHSHHNMGAFFSTVDDNALIQESCNYNHFLSLVVDTRGTYVARVTRRLAVKQKIHAVIVETVSYPSYNNAQITLEESAPVEKDIDNSIEKIVAYDLKVERPIIQSDIPEEWAKDVEDARRRSTQNLSTSRGVTYTGYNPNYTNGYMKPVVTPNVPTKPVAPPATPKHVQSANTNTLASRLDESSKKAVETVFPKEPELFPDELDDVPRFPVPKATSGKKDPASTEYDVAVEETLEGLITDEDVNYMVLQLVTGSLMANKSAIPNLQQYVTKLPTIVQERFETEESYLDAMDRLCDIIIDTYEDVTNPMTEEYQTFCNMCIEKIQKRLMSFKHSNPIIVELADSITKLYS